MINSEDISVVIQGPINREWIVKSIETIRKFLPHAEVIVSTWIGSSVEGIDCDLLILNEDPGNVDFYENDDTELPPYIDKNQKHNLTRQIISSLNGIKQAKRKYVLKMRSDLILTGTSFLKFFKKFNRRNKSCRIFKDRVVASIATRRSDCLPFHPGDWLFFGNREDLLDLYNIDCPVEPQMTRYFYSHEKPILYKNHPFGFHRCQYITEQWIWYQFLKKHIEIDFKHFLDITDENIRLSDLSFANNLVIISLEQFNIKSLKYPYLPSKIDYCYYYNDWKYLYIKYCSIFSKLILSIDKDRKIKSKINILKLKLKIFLTPFKSVIEWIKSFFDIMCLNIQLGILVVKKVYRGDDEK